MPGGMEIARGARGRARVGAKGVLGGNRGWRGLGMDYRRATACRTAGVFGGHKGGTRAPKARGAASCPRQGARLPAPEMTGTAESENTEAHTELSVYPRPGGGAQFSVRHFLFTCCGA